MELLRAHQARKAADEAYKAAEAAVKAALGDATTATLDGSVVATWTRSTSRRPDQKRLKTDHPDLVADYTSETVTDRFLSPNNAKGMTMTELVPLSERITYSKALAASDLLPKQFRGRPENVLVALEYGAAFGPRPDGRHPRDSRGGGQTDGIGAADRRVGADGRAPAAGHWQRHGGARPGHPLR